MRYGYATGFATPLKDGIDYTLLQHISDAGYDFVEFPLMLLATLPLEATKEAVSRLADLGLGADSCCNLFPASIRITGPARDWQEARRYLDDAFERLRYLGTKKIVFGSSGARNLPEGTSIEQGFDEIIAFVSEVLLPYLVEHDIVLAMEPIGAYEANFINTLDEGMRVVHAVNHPRVRLLADSVHMLYGKEEPAKLRRYAAHLEHIHICEHDRVLPVNSVSQSLADILCTLREIRFDKTISFEPVPYGLTDMACALNKIKTFFA